MSEDVVQEATGEVKKLKAAMRKTKAADLEAEIMGYMPQSFVLAYYELVRTGLKGMTDSVEKSRRNGEGRNGAPPGSEGAVLLCEASLERKRVIDRKLRELARMDNSERRKVQPKCVSCGQFGHALWKYCAHCGAVWSKEGEGPGGGRLRRNGAMGKREGLAVVQKTSPPTGGVGEKGGGAPAEGGQRWVQLR